MLCNLLCISKLTYTAVFILNFGQFHNMYYYSFCRNHNPYHSTAMKDIRNVMNTFLKTYDNNVKSKPQLLQLRKEKYVRLRINSLCSVK
jgi:hypothetical protein